MIEIQVFSDEPRKERRKDGENSGPSYQSRANFYEVRSAELRLIRLLRSSAIHPPLPRELCALLSFSYSGPRPSYPPASPRPSEAILAPLASFSNPRRATLRPFLVIV